MQTENKMNKKQMDPLRFLKPKKKQRQRSTKNRNNHQSPHFIKTLNAFPQLSASPRHPSNKHFISKQQLKILPNFSSENNLEEQQLTLRNNQIKGKQYNCMRYFSKKVDDYMKRRNKKNHITYENKQNKYDLHNQTIDLSIDIELQNENKFVKLQDQNTQSNLENRYSIPHHFKSNNQNSINSEIQSNYRSCGQSSNNNFKNITLNKVQSNNTNNNYLNNNKLKITYEKQQQQNQEWFRKNPNQIPQEFRQLLQCQNCGRKFNKDSYQKHIRICQKVFFQKRKLFNSHQKRSTSKTSRNSKNNKKQ